MQRAHAVRAQIPGIACTERDVECFCDVSVCRFQDVCMLCEEMKTLLGKRAFFARGSLHFKRPKQPHALRFCLGDFQMPRSAGLLRSRRPLSGTSFVLGIRDLRILFKDPFAAAI